MFISNQSKLNSGSIQVAGKITGSFEKGYNLSLGLHDCEEKIKFTCFRYQKENNIRSILENAYVYGKTHNKSYVPIQINDPEKGKTETVYIPASLEASLKAVRSSYFSDPSQDSQTEAAFLQTVSKVEKTMRLLQKNEYFLISNKTSIEDPSNPNSQTAWKQSIAWNTKKGWRIEPVTAYPSGGFSQVFLTDNIAMRYLFNQDSIDISAKLIESINPKGDVIGIQKPKIGTAFTYYQIDTDETKNFATPFSVNHRCLADCSNADFSAEELPKMCARLIEGIKTLHNKGIYHLDIKPQNILYDGNGVVYLSDFDGAISDVSIDEYDLILTYSMVDYADYQKLKDLSSMTSNEKSFLFSKMDIFALGVTFYQAAAHLQQKNIWPYDSTEDSTSNEEKYFAHTITDDPSARAILEGVYNQDQTNMILKMLSEREHRPTAEEIATAFPPTLFTSDPATERNYLAEMKKAIVPPPPMIRKIENIAANILPIDPLKILQKAKPWDFVELSFA